MSEEEKTCRVCRGEGTESQPLLHPCKCRGSIKYIHQDCLMEWLKHSNKSTKKCDICNTPYKFRTIYDAEMPKRIPMKFIWGKLAQVVMTTTKKSLSIFFYITCLIIQVPLFWKQIGRIYTWIVDGTLPEANPTFTAALLFGELDFLKYNTPSGGTPLMLFQLRKFVDYTYFSGLRYILICIIVHLALFVEHEWVIRDEGYMKLLLKKIGKEPRTKLVDMLQEVLAGLRNDGEGGNAEANANLHRLETIARAINDLQEQPTNGRHEELLRRIVDQEEHNNNNNNNNSNNNNNNNHNNNNQGPEQGAVDAGNEALNYQVEDETSSEYDEDSGEEGNNEIAHPQDNNIHNDPVAENDAGDDTSRPGSFANLQREHENMFHGHENGHHNIERNIDLNVAPRQDEEDEESQNEFDGFDDMDINDEMPDNDGGAGDFMELLGIHLNLKTPLLLMLLCDVVISIYLFVCYLIPHMLGNFCITVLGGVFRVACSILSKFSYANYLISNASYLVYTKDGALRQSGFEFFDYTLSSVVEVIFKSIKRSTERLFIELNLSQMSLTERIFSLSLGYSLICFTIYKFMDSLIFRPKPIMGTPRKVYKIFFEISSTAKVFIVFAIEIFFFPVYCGCLLDFCAAPLLLPQFIRTHKYGSPVFMILFTSGYERLQVHYVRIALYWLFGTLYMLFFALFIGMVRGKILRPGVLFFIRSPDDPNARLIHDALVKPLSLQLSRIYLSAKVYTGFILVGIGAVTWGVRFIVTPDKGVPYNVFLPFQIPSMNTVFFNALVIGELVYNRSIIANYTQIYWRKAFEISSNKLRLSHFILGIPVPHERGRILYRNFIQMVLGVAQPDYSRPVTYRGALKLFEEDFRINACFVPDGNYIRAPDNDTVTRKFIKKLFVSVTKDDQLLTQKQDNSLSEESNNSDDSDEEISTDDAYTVVYCPPNFKARCFALICMLWVFSVILILSVLLLAVVIGRPTLRAFALVLEWTKIPTNIPDAYNFLFKLSEFDWRLVDLSSVCIGLKFELAFLKYFDYKYKLQHDQFGAQNEVAHEADEDADGGPGIMFLGRNLLPRFGQGILYLGVYFVSSFMWIIWALSVHKLCIDLPFRVFTGLSLDNKDDQYQVFLDLVITKRTLVFHLLLCLWTIVPFFTCCKIVDLRDDMMNAVGRRAIFHKSGLNKVIINFSILHFPASLFMLWQHRHESWGSFNLDGTDTYIWAVMLLVFIITKTIIGGARLFTSINDQVKNERYVRGRAIENVDISGEE